MMKPYLAATMLAWSLGASPGLAQQAPLTPPSGAHVSAIVAAETVAGINGFSLDLYKRSVDANQNIFISPASVSTAVGLAYRGARGATATQLRSTLRYPASPAAYLTANAAVLRSLCISEEGRELRATNALWVERTMPLRPDYVADLAAQAGAGLQRVDFRGDPDGARRTINHWVEDATHDRIRDLLHDGDVVDKTRAALVNNLYWKGRWAAPFASDSTKTGPFTSLDGRRTDTLLMHQRGEFRTAEHRGVKAIELPYVGGEVSMMVLLPNAPSALLQLERKLTDGDLARWFKALDGAPARDAVLTLPRIRLEWRGDVAPMLGSLGAAAPFRDDADYSGIALEPFPGEVEGAKGLTIKHIIHTRLGWMSTSGAQKRQRRPPSWPTWWSPGCSAAPPLLRRSSFKPTSRSCSCCATSAPA